MIRLSETIPGRAYVITWFITSSKALTKIKETYKLREDTRLNVLQNTNGNIILRVDEKKLALTSDMNYHPHAEYPMEDGI